MFFKSFRLIESKINRSGLAIIMSVETVQNVKCLKTLFRSLRTPCWFIVFDNPPILPLATLLTTLHKSHNYNNNRVLERKVDIKILNHTFFYGSKQFSIKLYCFSHVRSLKIGKMFRFSPFRYHSSVELRLLPVKGTTIPGSCLK